MLRQPTVIIPVPTKLLLEYRRRPVAIGIYMLIARLYMTYQEPVPLSRNDFHKFDPRTSIGSVANTCTRLIQQSWLSRTREGGLERSVYHPAWKYRNGHNRLWKIEHNRVVVPHVVETISISSRVFDDYFGFINIVSFSNYIYHTQTEAIISLRDIGDYALSIASIKHPTHILITAGLIDEHGIDLL